MKRLLLALALAVAAAAASALPDAFALDRAALMNGEVWRLWTGHLVHASRAHFLFDVGAAVLLVAWFGMGRALLWLAPCVGLGVLAFQPELASYCGLSGVLHGLTILAALEVGGVLGWGIAAGTLGKAIVETCLHQSLFTSSYPMGGPVIHVAHLAGALAALFWARGVLAASRPALRAG